MTMAPMVRCIEPEWLDRLAPDDPRAVRSRRDLQRVNRVMGNATILDGALRKAQRQNLPLQPRLIVELGAGDGTLLLRILQRPALRWAGGRILLVDQQNLVTAHTRAAFHELGWRVDTVTSDILSWLQEPSVDAVDVMVANLVLHHFHPPHLTQVLAAVAAQANLFVACEPRRSHRALAGSYLLGALGCNDVSRHDAVVSVRAGFTDQELSALWPASPPYRLEEYAAGLFSHCFVAQRVLN